VVDSSAIRVFTNGHCHSFALAIHLLIPAARAMHVQYESHVVAALPSGEVIDVNGEGYADRVLDEDFTERSGNDWLRDDYKVPRAEDALPWAEAVLRDLNIPF
jgi:hypothetical protein